MAAWINTPSHRRWVTRELTRICRMRGPAFRRELERFHLHLPVGEPVDMASVDNMIRHAAHPAHHPKQALAMASGAAVLQSSRHDGPVKGAVSTALPRAYMRKKSDDIDWGWWVKVVLLSGTALALAIGPGAYAYDNYETLKTGAQTNFDGLKTIGTGINTTFWKNAYVPYNWFVAHKPEWMTWPGEKKSDGWFSLSA